jgi:hypothetical protein
MAVSKRVGPSSKIETIIADWRTGAYTQRDLAAKHEVSKGFVGKHTKDVAQDTKQVVGKILEVNQMLSVLDGQTVGSINQAVGIKERIRSAIEVVVEEAVVKASELLKASDSGSDYNQIMSGLDKASITAGVNDRHAKPAQTTMQVNVAPESLTDQQILDRANQLIMRLKCVN